MLTPVLGPEYFFPSYIQYQVVGNPTASIGISGFSGSLPKSHLDLFAPETGEIDLFVRVYPEWFKELTLSWSIPPSWEGQNPRFNVYRSEVEGSGYQKLNAVPLTSPMFKDDSTLESSKHSKEFYIVESLLDNGTVWKTPVAYVGDRLPRWQHIRLKEINRREWILLRKFAGTECLLLRRIRYADRCPECWDKVSEKVIQSHCKTCYGTGFKDGYYPGVRTYFQIDASADNLVTTYFGKFEANEVGAWTIQYPDVEPLDMIVRLKDYKIFLVKQISNTEIQNKICRQIMRLEEQTKNSVIYSILKREVPNSV